MRSSDEIELFIDEGTDRDDTTAARAAIDAMELIQLDEGSWWSDEGGADKEPRTGRTKLPTPAASR